MCWLIPVLCIENCIVNLIDCNAIDCNNNVFSRKAMFVARPVAIVSFKQLKPATYSFKLLKHTVVSVYTPAPPAGQLEHNSLFKKKECTLVQPIRKQDHNTCKIFKMKKLQYKNWFCTIDPRLHQTNINDQTSL